MVQILKSSTVQAGKLDWEPQMLMGDSSPSREIQTADILINISQN